MSFTNAPVTRSLVLGTIAMSIAASLFDIKHYFYISVGTHIWRYRQLWRILTYQLCYTNSSEVLFAAMALYNVRSIEQLWGSRKYASFIIITGLLTSVIPPVLMTLVLRPLSFGVIDFLPAGPTPIIFAILAQYHALVPHTYKYKVALSTGAPSSEETAGLTFSDKSSRYLMAIQLALFQWPGSLLGATVGWVVGYFWRNELLPGALTQWRVPGWIVGIRSQKRSGEFEGLQRRLEGESSTGTASGAQAAGDGEPSRRRTMGQQLLEEVRGAF
ncbi:UBA domain-containing protein Ucp14 [Cercophora newfieldiana]|uniref:UBA domain-containing protein Ucp14 n=1 Tax=Cercophora newfieldiana TaxID=92897 RepID=A0AA40CVG0_9PEZI|nr:UBA domain-containing protein Ucp14 [Cercophora newfieldiana]